MPIDFEIPEDANRVREQVRSWVQDECLPVEARATNETVVADLAVLKRKARQQGLWNPFIPKEFGGMGLGPLANALVQMELGESLLAALSLNCVAPDDATMLTLLEHGTPYQKERFLKPLLDGEKRICYCMTERGAGADATGMQTSAVKTSDGAYVLNGDKWFATSAGIADFAMVMAKTNPEAPRHKQFSTFLVELPAPGFEIVREIPTMAIEMPLASFFHHGHSAIRITNLVLPAENLLGGEGAGFSMGQHRLAYGRLRHGMHNIAMAQRALDLAAAHDIPLDVWQAPGRSPRRAVDPR